MHGSQIHAVSAGENPLAVCAAPAQRAWPDQFVTFQREITSAGDPEISDLEVSLTCWEAKAHVKASILAGFLQRWSLLEILVGDHVATLSLAPGEIQLIEVRRTGRTLLEESRDTATTVEEAGEQTQTDKEAINVANTSARSSNWSVSGTGGFSISGIGASASSTQAGTVSSGLSSTVDEVHEATLRSSQKVSTQTKLQVRGVTETAVETRQTRTLRNPFLDRALALNLYEINKRFEVRTESDGLVPMLTAHISALDFGDPGFARQFIAANAPFLSEALFDEGLRQALPSIVGSIREYRINQDRQEQVQQRLTDALNDVESYLFDNRPGFQPYHHPNDPEDIIFDESGPIGIGAFADARDDPGQRTASVDAGNVHVDALQLFLVLHAAHTLRYNPQSVFKAERQRIFTGLAATVDALWNTGLDDGQRMSLLDRSAKTELFRRIPGFLFLWKSLVDNISVPPSEDSETASLAEALEAHLRCHDQYYTEQYLRFLWTRLGRTFIVRLVNGVLHAVYEGTKAPLDLDPCRPYRNLYRVEDVQRDGLCVHIPLQQAASQSLGSGSGPGASSLSQALDKLAVALAAATSPEPRVDEVLVPADGMHIEPVAGACVLPVTEGDHSQGHGHHGHHGHDGHHGHHGHHGDHDGDDDRDSDDGDGGDHGDYGDDHKPGKERATPLA